VATSPAKLVEQLVDGKARENREPVVSELERQSVLWAKLKRHLEARIARLRALNDRPRSADETARLRGRIAEAKSLLALDNPAPAMDADDSD
jgi:hypothetical protein